MKKTLRMKFMLLLCALVVGIGNVWADDTTVTWSISGVATSASYAPVNTALTASSITPSGASGTWTAVSSGTSSYAASSSGAQLGASSNRQFNGTVSLSNSSIPSDAIIKSVSVTIGATNVTSTTLAVTVNNNSLGDSQTISAAGTKTFNTTQRTGNSIVLTFTNTTASKYFKITSISVTYSTSSGGGGTTTSDFAITDAPVALSFDLYNDYSAKTVRYTTSSTGTVSVVANDYITTSVNESTKTITVTPKSSVTPSAQSITVNQDADATYAAGSGTFTVTISDSTPPATYDFTNIDGFSSWGSGYTEHTVTYYDAQVIFASANKQNGTITNQPVTKGGDVVLKMTDGSKISEVKFVCTQWGNKKQTITLHYSTNGGSSYTSTGITSTDFRITDNNLPDETNAVKITFSSTDNQVGITSATIVKVCEKSIAGCGDSGKAGYYLIASPVASVTPTADNGFLANQYDLYRFNQSSVGAEWENWKATTNDNHSDFTALVSSKGYLYANSKDVTLYFTGHPYTGDGEVALAYDNTASAKCKGWNLIGNPYNSSATVSTSFYIMNDARDELTASQTNTVGAMEGIFVKATGEDQSVTFTQGSKRSINSQIVLNVVGNNDNLIDRAIVRFDENGTLPKFMIDEDNTKIYIPQNNKNFAVVNSNGKADMPVNFKAKEMGKYTISVNTEGIDMDYLHLIDRLTGEDVNLLLDNSYSFIASKQDMESRFILSFTATGYNQDADEPFAFQNGSDIIVNGSGELQIFDLMGRMVSTQNVNGIEIINIKSQGVYIFRLNEKTQKIVVR